MRGKELAAGICTLSLSNNSPAGRDFLAQCDHDQAGNTYFVCYVGGESVRRRHFRSLDFPGSLGRDSGTCTVLDEAKMVKDLANRYDVSPFVQLLNLLPLGLVVRICCLILLLF
jgi:hypothetical protein